MKSIIVPLASFGLVMLGVGAASAASPAYCTVYAKEFVKQAAADGQGSVPVNRIRDRAYHKCLNMDDEPPLPTAYTDQGTGGIGGPLVEEEGSATSDVKAVISVEPKVDATAIDEAIVKKTATIEAAASAPAGQGRGSGLAMWSPEWKKWCAEHFPNSFDPKTGTIIPLKTGKRTICR